MRVAAIQHDIVWEDRDANLDRLAAQIARAAAGGARLALLTEMFATGFSMATEKIAEPPEGPTATFLREQAAGLGLWVGASFPCRSDPGARPANRFLLAGPDGSAQRYDKIHPFSYSGEDEHYAPGTRRVTVDVEGVRITPSVCYDLRFADHFWDAALGTDCYTVVASWPASRQAHWDTLVRARAIENQAYVVAVNRVGDGGGTAYRGGSAVVGPFGEVLAAGGTAEEILLAEVDPGRVAEVRARYPFLQDR